MKPVSDAERAKVERATLDFWAERAESFSAALSRNLALLRDIESAVSSLQLERDIVESLSRFCEREANRLRTKPLKQKIDPDSEIQKNLLGAQEGLQRRYAKLGQGRRSARADSRLHPDDGVEDGFTATIDALSELHNQINTLRLAVGEHDANLSKVTGKFKSADDLTAYLKEKYG